MIHENPDDLGYWVGDSGYIEEPSDLSICNSILDPWEQGQIEHAAALEWRGFPDHAERHRKLAGYTN